MILAQRQPSRVKPFFNQRILRAHFLQKAPFFGVVAWLSWITLGSMDSIILSDAPLLERALLAAKGLVFYLEKAFWPHPLSALYPRPKEVSATDWSYLYPLLVREPITRKGPRWTTIQERRKPPQPLPG